MRRWAVLLVVVGLLSTACRRTDYFETLRGVVTTSGNVPRAFTYSTVADDHAFTVSGEAQDDLRYSMVLSQQGRELVEYVIRDDSLSVRLRDPAFGARLANVLGDPVVDAALRQGRWVTDPAGAPSLVRSDVRGATESSGDPFRDARDVLDFLTAAMTAGRDVRLFSLDDVEYRSQLDPWEYPEDEGKEERYDVLRPFLPISEAAATAGSIQGSVGPAQFRKLSVFVEKRRVMKVCSVIDVEGHEEFLALRRRGLDSNPFLRDLLEQIRTGETATPIEQRYLVADVRYPSRVEVNAPSDAVTGRLETFQSALRQGVTSGALRPAERVDVTRCRRTDA
ncbi:MAG: hypothetical protein ACRDKJ_09665, partial [Actinomycetota bacterium]